LRGEIALKSQIKCRSKS